MQYILVYKHCLFCIYDMLERDGGTRTDYRPAKEELTKLRRGAVLLCLRMYLAGPEVTWVRKRAVTLRQGQI